MDICNTNLHTKSDKKIQDLLERQKMGEDCQLELDSYLLQSWTEYCNIDLNISNSIFTNVANIVRIALKIVRMNTCKLQISKN